MKTIEAPGKTCHACFTLPLHCAPTLNRIAEMNSWQRAKVKKDCLTRMFFQARGARKEPLPGRPIVIAIRFSSVEPDRDSGWPKFPVDRLTGANQGLSFIVDDKPSAIDLRYWHSKAPPSKGFVYLEVWT
jgi:hypothetical protein